MAKPPAFGLPEAESIGIQALGYLATNPAAMERFLALTGVSIDTVRGDAGAPYMLAAILDHLAGNDSELMAFAANAQIRPETITLAASVLHAAAGSMER